MILLFAILLILLEASYEGLKLRKAYILSEIIEFIFLSLVIFCTLSFVSGINFPFELKYIPYWKIIAGYVLLRLAIFDIIWNLSAGQKWNYYGTTKLYDKIMTELGDLGRFWKAVCGIVGGCFLMGWQ